MCMRLIAYPYTHQTHTHTVYIVKLSRSHYVYAMGASALDLNTVYTRGTCLII